MPLGAASAFARGKSPGIAAKNDGEKMTIVAKAAAGAGAAVYSIA